MPRHYIPQPILRAARVLELLASQKAPMRLSQISRALGISKSSLLGVLSALEHLGWLQRESASGSYRIGAGLLELSRKAFGEWDLPIVAKPLMEQLAESLGESIFLGVVQEEHMVILACVEGRGQMSVTSSPGTRLPLLAAATGKILLAGMSHEQARQLLETHTLPKFTERSICDPTRFMEEVQRARSLGYATDDEEYLRGIRAVAAPLQHGGLTIGALWLVGFSSRLSLSSLHQAGKELVRTSGIISRMISSQAQV